MSYSGILLLHQGENLLHSMMMMIIVMKMNMKRFLIFLFQLGKNNLTFLLFFNELKTKGKLLIENYSLRIKSKLVKNLKVSILHLKCFPSYLISFRTFYII